MSNEELSDDQMAELIDKCFCPTNTERVNPFLGLSVDALGLLTEAIQRTLQSGVHIGYNIEDVERLSKLTAEQQEAEIRAGGLRTSLNGPPLSPFEMNTLHLLDAYIIRAMEESETVEHSAELIYELEQMLQDE